VSVIIYTLPNCAQCDQTKKAFERAGVPFGELKIDDSEDLMRQVKEMGYMSAPVVVTDFGSWSGFRPDRIKETVKRFNEEKN